MADPIVLDEFGGKLYTEVFEGHRMAFYQQASENIGNHSCGGDCVLYSHSETHNVLVCTNCHFRIVIPKEVDTYGKLRQWCQEPIKQRWIQKKMLLVCWGFVPIAEKSNIFGVLDREWERESVRLGLKKAETEGACDCDHDCKCGSSAEIYGLAPIPRLRVKGSEEK